MARTPQLDYDRVQLDYLEALPETAGTNCLRGIDLVLPASAGAAQRTR